MSPDEAAGVVRSRFNGPGRSESLSTNFDGMEPEVLFNALTQGVALTNEEQDAK
jgi:hypothetical protein